MIKLLKILFLRIRVYFAENRAFRAWLWGQPLREKSEWRTVYKLEDRIADLRGVK